MKSPQDKFDVIASEARAIVTDWLGMFDPPPQIDFQQSELLQQAIASALRDTTARIEALEAALQEAETLGKYWQNKAIKAEGIPAALAPEPTTTGNKRYPREEDDENNDEGA